jgi:hypothetical protein
MLARDVQERLRFADSGALRSRPTCSFVLCTLLAITLFSVVLLHLLCVFRISSSILAGR